MGFYTQKYNYLVTIFPYLNLPLRERFKFKLQFFFRDRFNNTPRFIIKPIVDGVLYMGYKKTNDLNDKGSDNKKSENSNLISVYIFLYAGNNFSITNNSGNNFKKLYKNLEPIYVVHVMKIYNINRINIDRNKEIKKNMDNTKKPFESVSFLISSDNLNIMYYQNNKGTSDNFIGRFFKKYLFEISYNQKYCIHYTHRVARNSEKQSVKEDSKQERNVILYLISVAAKYKFIEDLLFYGKRTEEFYHWNFIRPWRAFRYIFLDGWWGYFTVAVLAISVYLFLPHAVLNMFGLINSPRIIKSVSHLLPKGSILHHITEVIYHSIQNLYSFARNKENVNSGFSFFITIVVFILLYGAYSIDGVNRARIAEVKKLKLLFFKNAQIKTPIELREEFWYLNESNKGSLFRHVYSISRLILGYEDNLIHRLFSKNNTIYSEIHDTLLREFVSMLLSSEEKSILSDVRRI